MSEIEDELIAHVKSFIGHFVEDERGFGSSTALLKYGVQFQVRECNPDWLESGKARDCFNNATAYAVARADVLYAEGYAFEPDLPLPVQHAWLVDREGRVIDPTWKETKDHVYFGIAFSREFVTRWLAANSGQAGLLVNMHLLRRGRREPAELEKEVCSGIANLDRLLESRV